MNRARTKGRRQTRSYQRGMPVVVLVILLVVLAFGGGSAKVNVASLMFIRPVLALGVAGLLFLPVAARDTAGARIPILLLALFAGLMVLQLIPLPPFIWQHLPGHNVYVQVAVLAGEPQPWRPISVAPILTLNSLLSLLAPLALFMTIRRVSPEHYELVTLSVIILAAVSCLMGVIQTTGGDQSPAYLYSYAKPGFAPGLLANRNHQAAWLAAMLPLITSWALSARDNRQGVSNRQWTAWLLGIVFVVLIVMTSSRSGFGLALLGLLGSGWLIIQHRSYKQSQFGSRNRWMLFGALGLGAIAVIMLPLLAGREAVFARLANSGDDASASLRMAALPITIGLIGKFFPTGSGFGTFDPVFRAVEPDALLAPGYFNNAHNDLIELAITGGIPAILLLLVLIGWIGMRAKRIFSRRENHNIPSSALAQAAIMFLAIQLLASLSDYPLRTPLLSGVFGLVIGLVASLDSKGPRISSENSTHLSDPNRS